MAEKTASEAYADWCAQGPHVVICGTRMKEVRRESRGERWCFYHRRREEFFFVVNAPDGMSYYDPSPSIEGPTRYCTDLFPGVERVWGEDW